MIIAYTLSQIHYAVFIPEACCLLLMLCIIHIILLIKIRFALAVVDTDMYYSVFQDTMQDCKDG